MAAVRVKSTISALLVCACVSLTALTSSAAAAPGDLDTGFGTDGIVRVGGADLENAGALDVAVAPDGKIVIVGESAGALSANAFILRLLPNGAPDPSFSGDGLLLTQLGNTLASAKSVLIQPDRKIVIAGLVTAGGPVSSPVIARFTEGGELDPSFSPASSLPGAFFATFFGADAEFHSVARQSDGRIVATGARLGIPKTWLTMAVTSGGILDTTYSVPSGYFLQQFLSDNAEASAIALRPDNRSVICGYGAGSAPDPVSFAFMARTNVGGADIGFNVSGQNVVPLVSGSMNDSCRAVALQPDGKAVAAGMITDGSSSSNAVLTRVNENGLQDSTFANNGVLVETLGEPVSFTNDVVVEPSGRIIAVGRSRFAGVGEHAVWGYLPSGAPDPSFGTNGYAGRALGGWALAVALTADNRAIVMGRGADDALAFAVKLRDDPPTPLLPTARARITSPKTSKVKRRRFKRISGTATAMGAGVSKVEVAVFKAGARKSKRCLWLSSPAKAKFRSLKKPRTGCNKQIWLKANGTAKWSLKLRRQLPPGKYTVYARATALGGLPETSFSRGLKNRRAVRIAR